MQLETARGAAQPRYTHLQVSLGLQASTVTEQTRSHQALGRSPPSRGGGIPDRGSGFFDTGKIEAGYIQTGDRMLTMPPNETCTVKGTQMHAHTHTHSVLDYCD